MEALDMLLTRRSVKRFAPDSLPSVADLQRIADAGANAPTGRGRQSPFIVVVTDRTVRDELSRLNAEHFPSHTPPRKEGYIRFV